MQLRKEAGGEVDLPWLDLELVGLVSCLFDVGPTGVNGQLITWSELEAWQRATGFSLPPWQLRLLRQLSAEYAAEAANATAHDAPPPWDRSADRERIGQHVKRVMRGR